MAKKSKPLKGVSNALNVVTTGFYNRGVADSLYLTLVKSLQRNPLYGMELTYNGNRGGLIANAMGVFQPFVHEDRKIYPTEILDDFFETNDRLYRMILEGIANSIEKIVKGEQISREVLPEDFKKTLEKEVLLSQDVALWINYLSQRGGVVSSVIRGKLAKLGITNPQYLAHDVQTLGENILGLCSPK